ncbi:MAG: glycosyltransferase family 39 protein, partial [Anaerolineales bacterium]|nr:glycosyltransferase family 39 protein [Anaerolineales bacterium]
RALGGERVGLAAVWLYALSPNALFWAGTIMTETFFAFWLALALALLIHAVQRDSWRRGAASGLALGLAVLTRPIGLYLIPLWAVGALVAAWRRTPHRRALANAVVLLLAALTPVLTWQTRNLLVHDSFRLTASFRTVFVDYTAASTLGEARGISRDEAAAQLRQSPDAFAAALDAVRRYPGSLVRVSLQGIARTALGTEAGTWLGILNGKAYQSSGLLGSLLRGDLRGTADALSLRLQASEDRLGTALLLWGLLYSAAVYLLGFRGLMRLRGLQPGNLRWLCAGVLLSTGYLIVLPLTIGDARFRVPVEPLLALLGSMGFTKRPALAAPAGQASE